MSGIVLIAVIYFIMTISSVFRTKICPRKKIQVLELMSKIWEDLRALERPSCFSYNGRYRKKNLTARSLIKMLIIKIKIFITINHQKFFLFIYLESFRHK